MSADYYRISRSALVPRQKTHRYNNKNNMRTSGDKPTSCWDHRVSAEKLSIPLVCFLNSKYECTPSKKLTVRLDRPSIAFTEDDPAAAVARSTLNLSHPVVRLTLTRGEPLRKPLRPVTQCVRLSRAACLGLVTTCRKAVLEAVNSGFRPITENEQSG